jgi:hypothetical protein
MKRALLILFCACASAGGGSGDLRAETAPTPAQSLWMHRCGSCHERVEPGQYTHEELTEPLMDHRKRVRLSAQQWEELMAFLARPSTQRQP